MESSEQRKSESKGKPPFVYHGSNVAGIEELKPQKRFTPAEDVGLLVYASDLPAFAAAHSFPWSTDEGFDVNVNEEQITLIAPGRFKERLMVPVYIYKLPSEQFSWNVQESTGHTLSSDKNIQPLSVERFDSVEKAVRHFGGEVTYKPESI